VAAGRRVSLVLSDGNGDVLGALPSFTVDDPWWPEVGPVVSAARERFGAEVVVLRMLRVASDADNGGDVTYLAELVGEPSDLPLGPALRVDEGEEPLRAAWARPGGVADTIAWADDALAGIGRPRIGPADQIKTWNLSSVLRLPTAAGDVWCKSVPPFLTHEGAIIELVGMLVRPFALTMRLAANMTGGHIAILAILSFVFLFTELFGRAVAGIGVGLAVSIPLAVGISGLEILVVLIQAYVFTLLTAVFIGMAIHVHH